MPNIMSELRTILADVRRRWARRALLRAWMLGAATAAAMLLVGFAAVWLVARDGVPLVLAVVAVSAVAAVSLVFALLPLRHAPTDKQIARFIEERAGGLDDVLVTVVDQGLDARGPMADILVHDATRATRQLDLDRVISRQTLLRAAAGAALGSAALLVAMVLFAPSATRAANVVGSYLFPRSYTIEVTPGSAKVRTGFPLQIVARIAGIDGGLVPMLTVGTGADARSARMSPGDAPGEFTITLNNVTVSFPYSVSAGSARSAEYTIDVIRPVRIARIDLAFEYPRGVGLAPHTEEDSGDIYAPAGTRVTVTVTTDKPVTRAQLTMADGTAMAMSGSHLRQGDGAQAGKVVTADLLIAKDGSYRVALNDIDGLSSEGDTEYFIRMLDDRPPDVRILRPAGDKQVSPLEEVAIEARADDDYGLAALELVFKTSAGTQTVVPLGSPVSGSIAAGTHTVFLEDLKVKPGDFVTYHARARDLGRGRRASEARSDIFFLEVKPYEEEFVASESQAGGGGGQQSAGVEELAAMQKDIIAATWKLDARARRAKDARPEQDIKAVAKAQSALKSKTEELAAQIAGQAFAERRRRGAQPGRRAAATTEDPLPRAVEAMGRAAAELDRLQTAKSLPHEEEALGQLLKAAAEIRRRQVQRQQAQGGGGGNGNRQQPDLSTLFDQELRKKQQTNYETPPTTETRNDQPQDDDPLSSIRELARRQEALSRQQKELAKNKEQLAEEELQRQLERLTRDQEELRKQAEQLAQQQNEQGSSSEGRKMREIADEMRNAAKELGRQDPQQAGVRGDRATQQLRSLEQQMQGASPDERRRALGDLQLEARQLADAERRLGNESAKTAEGAAGEDARRRLAAEQQRLADRTDRLSETMKQLAKGPAEGEPQNPFDSAQGRRQAMTDASRELERQRLSERMRESAKAMRQGAKADPQGQARPEDLARGLDTVAERLGAATGGRDGETARLSDQLGKTQELRDRLSELQKTMDALSKAGDTPQPGQEGPGAPATRTLRDGVEKQPGAEGRDGPAGQQGTSEGGRAGAVQRLQREADEKMREAQRLADEVQKQNPGMQKGGSTPEQWQRSTSAPGTESFKQDFAKWESLKKNLLAALEQTESQLSDQLRARENKERLNAGRHDAVADTYRELVDRYYQSLAAPRRQPR
ncbi:MAG: hypothetical protein Q7R30_18065 [Acidobacteriota bacterium]|nr:hypothetical protein [Acidobacteriota bacterium]